MRSDSGSSAATPGGPSGRPMSLELTTSVASVPSAWPTWPPKIRPPIWLIMPISGAAIVCISAGSASPIAADTRPATGSTSSVHAGRVASSQRRRLQASAEATPEGSAVTGFSQTSASRIASATSVVSLPVVPVSAPITAIAEVRATCQFTGPDSPDIMLPSCCSIAPRSGMPPRAANGSTADSSLRFVAFAAREAERGFGHESTVAVKMGPVTQTRSVVRRRRSTPTIGVTGAAGPLGRALVERLAGHPASPRIVAIDTVRRADAPASRGGWPTYAIPLWPAG